MPKLLDREPRIKRSVVLDPEENDTINAIARTERRSFNSIIRQAIAEFLARRQERKEAA